MFPLDYINSVRIDVFFSVFFYFVRILFIATYVCISASESQWSVHLALGVVGLDSIAGSIRAVT